MINKLLPGLFSEEAPNWRVVKSEPAARIKVIDCVIEPVTGPLSSSIFVKIYGIEKMIQAMAHCRQCINIYSSANINLQNRANFFKISP